MFDLSEVDLFSNIIQLLPFKHFTLPSILPTTVWSAIKVCEDGVSSFQMKSKFRLYWVLNLVLISAGVLVTINSEVPWTLLITIWRMAINQFREFLGKLQTSFLILIRISFYPKFLIEIKNVLLEVNHIESEILYKK